MVDTVLYLVGMLLSVTSVKNDIDRDGPGTGGADSGVESLMLFNSLA